VISNIKNVKINSAKKMAGVILFLSIWGLFTSNPALTFAGLWLLPFLLYLLWQPGEPPSFLIVVFYQWLQVFTPVLDANIQGDVLGVGINLPEQEMATYLGYITIIFLAIGIKCGVGRKALEISNKVVMTTPLFEKRSLLSLYLIFFLFSLFIGAVMWLVPSATQLLGALKIYKWAVIFLIIWLAVLRKDIRILAGSIVLLEIFIGFLGFFGAFKTVFLILIVALTAHDKKRFLGLNARFVAILVPLVILALVWQAIKVDYRAFQQQGEATQVAQVSNEQKAEYLAGALAALHPVDIISSFDSLVSRLGYTEFFGYSIAMVPDNIPFQNGRLWGEALVRVVTPRMFFPDKSALDDSSRTREFTGIRVASAEEGASVGLGYASESYIDFGPYLMFFPIFLLGFLFGFGYRLFLQIPLPSFIGFSIGNAFVISSGFLFESSGIKFLGGMLTVMLVNITILKLISLINKSKTKII
jgi:hypothetical protein